MGAALRMPNIFFNLERSMMKSIEPWSRFSLKGRPQTAGGRPNRFNRGYGLGCSAGLNATLRGKNAGGGAWHPLHSIARNSSKIWCALTGQGTIVLLMLLLCATGFTNAQQALQPVGQWREHLWYQNAIQVVAGAGRVFCATSNNVFSVDDTHTLQRFSKVTGLGDVGVQAIAWDSATQQLVIAYSNSNIDLLKGNTVRHLADVQRTTLPGNNAIGFVYTNAGQAYLCTGLGVVVLNLQRAEVADTWRTTPSAAGRQVNSFTIDPQYYYAATAGGLQRCLRTAANPADYRNWPYLPAFEGRPVQAVVHFTDTILALRNDTIFTTGGAVWYTDAAWQIVSTQVSGGRLLVCQRTPQGNSRVIALTPQAQVDRVVQQSGVVSLPRWALLQHGSLWVADFFGGLSKHTGSSFERFIPNGPPGTATGAMLVHNSTLYAAAGSVNDAWNYQYNRNGVYHFANGQWKFTGAFNTPRLDSVLDFITLAVDPATNHAWAGSYGGGLVEFAGNNINIYKHNSSLQPAIGDAGSYRVSGLAFDSKNNLWIANYGALQNLHVRKPDGTFKAFSIPFFHFENAISQLATDEQNHIWMVSPRGNGVFVYDPGQSVDATADDRWRYLRAGAGNGNLPDNNVYCLALDKDGFMWIGTARGIGVVNCTSSIFSGNACEATLPIVQHDRFAGFLFQNETVQAIAVDGANRKWVGTRNGLWLISADGKKVIYRFSADNSPLLHNDVRSLAIDGRTGEVFIGTAAGICSFRSTATEAGSIPNDSVLVFPNPVPPGYTGTIAIRGLPNNAVVKITETNGRLVYQTRSLGGQAVWNGVNYKGEKTVAGVYLVLVRSDDGQERIATKIVLTGSR